MNNFLQSLRSLGTVRLTAMAAVGVGILVFFVYLMARMASPQMELLYGDLELQDAGQIVQKLQGEKSPYELRKDGTEVWVPKERKLDLRVRMAEANLPNGGGVNMGYEIFDKQDALGATAFMQNVNMVRALEGELGRTIRSIEKVKQARVHLVLPKREVFSRETQDPSASVVLRMVGNNRLAKPQVQAIQHIIAAAVPKLKPHRISIIDDRGTLLARGYENDTDMMAETADEMRLGYENKLGRQVEELLERSVGPGKVRAEVSAEMDFDRATVTEEKYDPESKVVRSETNVTEGTDTRENQNNAVSVSQNLPDANANSGTAVSQNKSNRSQGTVNYEISKTVSNRVKEMGAIKRLTVAVLIDGVWTTEEKGKPPVYRARDKKEVEDLATLARNAVGYDGSRGDQVDVINMPFYGNDQVVVEEVEEKIFGFPREFVEKVASNIGLSVVAILFLLLVLKPLASRAVESMSQQQERKLLLEMEPPQLAPPPPPAPGMLPDDIETVDELIDIEKVEGRVKASSIRKIGEIVEKHPEEALSIIRNWMYQEAGGGGG